MKNLSSEAQRILGWVHNTAELQRRQPSLRQIAAALGYSDHRQMDTYLEELEQVGWMQRRAGVPRRSVAWIDWGFSIRRPLVPPFASRQVAPDGEVNRA